MDINVYIQIIFCLRIFYIVLIYIMYFKINIIFKNTFTLLYNIDAYISLI